MKVALALALLVGCGGGSRASQAGAPAATEPTPPSPAPAQAQAPMPAPPPAADPVMPPPPLDPAASPGARTLTPETCIGAVDEARSPCGALRAGHQAWHRHGYVERQGKCFECWDEESDDCETVVTTRGGYRFLGQSCGSVPAATR